VSTRPIIEAALNDTCRDFNREVEKFGKTKLWRSLDDKAPVALGILTSAAAGIAGAIAPQKGKWVVGLTIGSAIFQYYKLFAASRGADLEHQNVYHTFADMRREILEPERFASLF